MRYGLVMPAGGTSVNGIGLDFLVLLASSTALIAIAVRVYPRLVQYARPRNPAHLYPTSTGRSALDTSR
ncbi:MAG: hypothetical protein ACRDHP_11890 [Ktedonobacterales bacterium]